MLEKTLYINESIFAARIFAISRFIDASPTLFAEKYSQLLSRYYNVAALVGILNNDTEYSYQHSLMVRAYELANTESDKTERSTNSGKNLSSVFSRLSISQEQKDRKKFYRYEMNELSPEKTFPKRDVSSIDYAHLINGFYNEMNNLTKYPPSGINELSVTFDRISRKYMWCISATDFEGEDISLYDLMKVTEALTACLMKCENEKSPYTLVAGDFSGIQKYIFSISSRNLSGVTKRLRARSFYVDVISRVLSQYVIDCFGVGRASILMQTGGKFYCVVPTSDDINTRLQGIRDAFDRSLFDVFHGAVSVNMAWICCNDENIRFYSDTIVALNRKLGEKKTEPFSSILKNDSGWKTAAFVLNNDLKEKHVCKSCGMELIPVSEDECPVCQMQFDMGTKLSTAQYIVYTRNEGMDTYRIFQDYYIRLLQNTNRDDLQNAYLIEILGDEPLKEEEAGLPYFYKYMANHLPTQEYTPMTFSDIADTGSGMHKLAVLKADVDVLGYLFSHGLRTTERHYGTISRVNTMSRMLEVFFCGYVKKLFEKDVYKNVYSVFSGGDDLFLIGPWDVMPKLAIDIHDKFKMFAADNPDITLSAAVAIFGGKEHIAYMAESSENQLDLAKNGTASSSVIYPQSNGRNAICYMNRIFSWDDFKDQMKNAAALQDLLESGMVNVAILRRIAKYSDMYQEFLIDKDIWKLMFEPLFYYDRARNYNTVADTWFINYVKTMENAANYKEIRKNLYFADITIKTALDKTKEGRN